MATENSGRKEIREADNVATRIAGVKLRGHATSKIFEKSKGIMTSQAIRSLVKRAKITQDFPRDSETYRAFVNEITKRWPTTRFDGELSIFYGYSWGYLNSDHPIIQASEEGTQWAYLVDSQSDRFYLRVDNGGKPTGDFLFGENNMMIDYDLGEREKVARVKQGAIDVGEFSADKDLEFPKESGKSKRPTVVAGLETFFGEGDKGRGKKRKAE